MEDIVLVGFGGHAKSVADTIERTGKFKIAGYTDSVKKESNYCYLGDDAVLYQIFEKGVKNAAIALGYMGKGSTRGEIYNLLKQIGFNIPTIVDPSAVVSDSVVLGEGTFVGKRAIVNSETKIGKGCIINTGAIVEHECIVGDFSHVSVGSVLCGQVQVGTYAFVGANAVVIQNRKIGERQIVPAGSTVR